MTRQGASNDTVGSVETMFAIVERLQELDGAGVSELASDLGFAKSTVHRHLATLEGMEYVVKKGDVYYVGLRFLDLGEYTRNRKLAYKMAGEKVSELAVETEERAQFIVEEHGKAVFIHRDTGDRAVLTDPGIGKRIPLHATAAGKAILAHLSDDELSRIIERRGLPKVTEYTITDEEALHEELENCRARGYSYNKQENLIGLHAVGVPVKDASGGVLGSLSISGPSHRLKGEWFERELPNLLLGSANELELNINYS